VILRIGAAGLELAGTLAAAAGAAAFLAVAGFGPAVAVAAMLGSAAPLFLVAAGLAPGGTVAVVGAAAFLAVAGFGPAVGLVATAGAGVLCLGVAGLRFGSGAGCGRAGGCWGMLCGLGASRRTSIWRFGSSV